LWEREFNNMCRSTLAGPPPIKFVLAFYLSIVINTAESSFLRNNEDY
jgi:hypothetical protein